MPPATVGRKVRGQSAFKKTEVTRAIKAARAGGLEVHQIEITNGKTVLRTSAAGARPPDDAQHETPEAVLRLV